VEVWWVCGVALMVEVWWVCGVALMVEVWVKGKELGYEFSEVDETGHKWYSLGKTLYVAAAAGKFLENMTDD